MKLLKHKPPREIIINKSELSHALPGLKDLPWQDHTPSFIPQRTNLISGHPSLIFLKHKEARPPLSDAALHPTEFTKPALDDSMHHFHYMARTLRTSFDRTTNCTWKPNLMA